MTRSMRHLVLETIRLRGLLAAGDCIVLAVSGGADSVALTHLLHALRKDLRVELSVAHLHHGLRGVEADEDAAAVASLAARLDLPFHAGKVDVRALAGRSGDSLEMAARQARYDFLCETAARIGATTVATGHTADDQVETMMLNLMRGTGLKGLTGIPYETLRASVRIVRPLLDVTHQDLVLFLQDLGLTWREDASNQEVDYLRNRVRHELLPLLEERINPGVRGVLLRLSDVLRAEDAWMDHEASRLLDDAVAEGSENGLDCRALRAGPLSIRRRALRQWLAAAGARPEDADFATVERLNRLVCDSKGTKAVSVGGGRRAVRAYDSLSLKPENTQAVASFRARLARPGETLLSEQGLRLVVQRVDGLGRKPRSGTGRLPAVGRVSRNAVGRAALYVRSPLPGDRIAPLGMKGSRKLQDLFVDEKVVRGERSQCPILECRGEVVWVPGYTVARGWEVEGDKSPAWEIEIERM